MFERQMGLRENPFVSGHNPRYVYPSREHQEALAHLRYGIENREPFVLITGEVGTGKTTAVYDAMSTWGERTRVALITNSALSRDELLEEICMRFGLGLQAPVSKPQAMALLERHLGEARARGEIAVLLIDEAQNLERTLLEEIRLLSNLEIEGEKLVQIYLVGQPELEEKLSRPELRQLRQRIAIRYKIQPLTEEETRNYLHHRLAVAGGNAHQLMPPETCREIYRLSHGIPREINIVAGQALVNAFAGDARVVRPEHVQAVESETGFSSVATIPQPAAASPRPLSAVAPPFTEPIAVPPVPPAPAVKPADASPAAPTPAPAPAAKPADVPPPASAPAAKPIAAPPPTPSPAPPSAPPARVDAPRREPYTAPEPVAAASAVPIEKEAEVSKVQDQPKSPGGDEPPPDVKMPAWLDDVLEKRKQVEAQMASERSPSTPPATKPPAASKSGSPPAEKPPSPPPRIAPHPSNPSGPKPPEEPRGAWISPRLRDKLGEPEVELDFTKKSSPLPWILGLLVVAGLAVGGVMMLRGGGAKKEAAPTPAPAVTTAPAVDTSAHATVDTAATGATPPASGPTASVPPPGTPPASKPATSTPAASKPAPAPGATPPPPAETRKYGVAVGTFLFEDRAATEKTRLETASGMSVRVQSVKEGGETVYRVVVGSFDDRASAEKAAADLLSKGLANEGTVVTLPR